VAHWPAWLLTVLAIHAIDWSLGGAILLNLLMIVPAHWLDAPGCPSARPSRGALSRRWFELPMRAALVGVVVATVVTASHALGPTVTAWRRSSLSRSPASPSCVAAPGGAASAAVMAGRDPCNAGFGLSLLVLHLAAEPLGAWSALAAMIATSLLWSVGMLVWRPARGQPTTLAAKPTR